MAFNFNLYPPLLADAAPAFLRNRVCRIYFSLSMYNLQSQIGHIQISLVNQKTNITAFNTDLYPAGIKIVTKTKTNQKILNYDETVQDDYNYYVEIYASDLAAGSFELNQFYKVQLRFGSANSSTLPSTGPTQQWLYENRNSFSEWSKVCLIKGIQQPTVQLHNFPQEQNQQTIISNSRVDLVGKVLFETNETEYLRNYNVKLYEKNSNDELTLISQSGDIYTNPLSPNQFNYQIQYDLTDGSNYEMIITFVTNNLYRWEENYHFSVIENGINKLEADIIASVDQENGRVKINIVSKNSERFIGNLTIRRSSSESNFHKWQDIKTVTYINDSVLDFVWYDTTIQSGVWYKYCAQKRSILGQRGAIIQTENPIMCILDNILLTRNNCQLKIKFNPSLNQFKYNVTESQQVTIGSKYPFVKRNGHNYFRTFPIGGLISSFIDTTDWYDPHFYDGQFHDDKNQIKAFASRQSIYGESLQLYDDYNDRKNITEYSDYIYEREFRQKVYDFLYSNDVKLFRSTTEGNILIKLMNIDFQPNETLGRRLYSFTATAVQIDEANIKNYDKYGIQYKGTYSTQVGYQHEVMGQIYGTYDLSKDNIITQIIQPKYKRLQNPGFKNEMKSLKWLRIEIESPPYTIIEENNGNLLMIGAPSSGVYTYDEIDNEQIPQVPQVPYAPPQTFPIPQIPQVSQVSQISWTPSKKLYSGHIVIINNKQMIIYPHIERRSINPGNHSLSKNATDTESQIVHIGVFQLKGDNVNIEDLKFKYPTTARIDYAGILMQKEDASNATSVIHYYVKPGQLFGTFKPKDSLMQKIYNKYLMRYTSFYQKLLDVTDIRVEGEPGTVIYVKDQKDSNFNRHVLQNGYLQLKDQSINIQGLYFNGIHLTECTDPLQTQIVNGLTEFTLQEGVYNNISEIQRPVNGGIYKIKTYGLSSDAILDDKHRLLTVNESRVEKNEVIVEDFETQLLTTNNLYTLLLDTITDDDKTNVVYYYGCWYFLKDGYEKIKLLKHDLRHLRKNEYILTNTYYNSIQDIKNPIPNGVYGIYSFSVDNSIFEEDNNPNVLRVGQNDVEESENTIYTQADKKYTLFIEKIIDEAKDLYIYYNETWYPFTKDHDVVCPVDGLVDYVCQVVKGEYANVT